MLTNIGVNCAQKNYSSKPKMKDLNLKSTSSTCTNNFQLTNAYYAPIISFKGINSHAIDKTKEQINGRLKELLDNKTFSFENPNGEKIEGTIKDYLESCITKIKKNDHSINMLHGTMAEKREQILTNGFDQEKIGRTVCGPGTCFTGSEYEAHMIGGGAIISCDYSGHTAHVMHGYYDNIVYKNEIKHIVADELGLNIKKETYSQLYFDKISKIEKEIGKYVRNVFTNDLNIDAIHDPGRPPSYPSCMVVFNTNSIKNIKKYN